MSGHTATPVCLPCPFCGSSNVDPKGWSTLPQYAATPEERSGPACDDCEATASSINMWNSRHNNSHAELVKALEEAALHLDDAQSGFISGCSSDTIWNQKRDEIVKAARAALATLTARKVG